VTVDEGIYAVGASHPLTDAEVAERVAAGEVNIVKAVESRSVASILRENILTRFNAIISVMLVIVLVFGHLADAMFGLVMIANAAIGIIQELRAKVTLDRLTVVAAPKATVRRADGDVEIPSSEIVIDDLLLLDRGTQIPVDGVVVETAGLEVSEALLTGEAEPVSKTIDTPVMSGSFVVSGTGVAFVRAVGDDAYASQLAAEAKQFTISKGELQSSINRILQMVTWLLIPTSALLLWSQIQSGQSISDAMVSAVAGVVAMVPQGLVLLVSVSLAVAVVRLAQRQVLVQELPAVEILARVNTICVDKTGTLTSGGIAFDQTINISGSALDESSILGSIAAADADPNATMEALKAAYPIDTPLTVASAVLFSSTRKTSAVSFTDGSAWLIGAPEFVLSPQQQTPLSEQITSFTSHAQRVIVVAESTPDSVAAGSPALGSPAFLLVFSEQIRPDAADTVAYFHEQGVEVKVISGDAPDTVAAVARSVGITPIVAFDATDLPEFDDPEFQRIVTETTVFGRVTPEQKRNIVSAQQDQGQVIAMTGDGVNDVLALKQADMGIAMGSGTGATRAVAQLVLLDDQFASLPDVVGEGRRVVANMERVASLFLSKTVYATLLALAIGFVGLAFPFLPRHMTLVGMFTIGIPAFVLSFESQDRPIRPGFLTRVLGFAIPAGLVAGLTTVALYGVSRMDSFGFTIEQSRTGATILMVFLGLIILHDLVAPPSRMNRLLIASLLGGFLIVLAIPAFRALFDLVLPGPYAWAVIIISAIAASIVLKVALAWSRKIMEHRPDAMRASET
jgi:cation-transporting ATPase E